MGDILGGSAAARSVGLTAAACCALVGLAPRAHAQTCTSYPCEAVAIPLQQGASAVPWFIGRPARPHRIQHATPIPQAPFFAANPWGSIHNDAYMSDTYPRSVPAPLGNQLEVWSSFLGIPTSQVPFALPAVMTFDRNGLLLVAASTFDTVKDQAFVRLSLIRPTDLATLATYDLPPELHPGAGFRPAGAYFYADQHDLTVIGTKDRTVQVVSHSLDANGRWSFRLEDEWDLTVAIPSDDQIEALQPDWSGRVWFTSKGGVVGTVGLDGKLLGYTWELRNAGERIVNGHAADEDGGVFIATTAAMYRFDADGEGRPVRTWRELYEAGSRVHPGQTDIGTGTTPTLMGKDYVTISDNAEPRMNVLVFRRAKHVDGSRLVCKQPVFRDGLTSNENSLIATDRSIIVENNYGYSGYRATTGGNTTTPGIARIDLNGHGGCRTVWSTEAVSIPSVVSKMSLATGLIYTYTKPAGPDDHTDPWYFTAIDFHTGKVMFQQLAGTGVLYNNHYAGAFVGPDGTLYVGVLGGVVAMRDGVAVGH